MVDLATFVAEQKNYAVEGNDVFYCGKCVAHVFKKHAFYDYLKTKGINWKEHISKQLLPDNAIYVIVNNTMFILEVKTQNVAGSVDEKLQTCDFKKKQYQKLLSQLNMEVQYIYILDDWFIDHTFTLPIACFAYWLDLLNTTLAAFFKKSLPVPAVV